MTDTVVCAEGLGKKYVISHRVRSDELFYDALTTAMLRIFKGGKLGVAGDKFDDFWALRDINFEIKRGEIVGIIGHNGAGKSTLLKILSRITEPTIGRVTIAGRVASLLEIGTGFHPELTGRENVFLNGSILGMKRAEVRQQFDEIVAFAGVEKFIDTPVKRYSVGMYARLAFAVAAHLESEILVVDEVLAVGDAEFQERCLNRMSTVANTGRTVLFVSHNLAAVSSLTHRALVLGAGHLTFDGSVPQALTYYGQTFGKSSPRLNWKHGRDSKLISAELLDERGNSTEKFVPGTIFNLRVIVETTGISGISIDLMLRDEMGLPFAFYSSGLFNQVSLPTQRGRYECVISLGSYRLAAGQYSIDVSTVYPNVYADHRVESALRFVVDSCSPGTGPFNFRQVRGSGRIAMKIARPIIFKKLAPL